MNKKQRKKEFRKLKSNVATALVGSYNGGSRSRPALRNWNPYSGDANDDTIYDLPTLRARSRDLARNAPIGGAALNTVVTNVIGTGLSMQSNPDATYLRWSEQQATAWKREVESEWQLWCCSHDCDASRKMNFYGLQSLALRSMLESGDVLSLTPAIKRSGPYALAIQLIEADRLRNKDNIRDTASMIEGITLDNNGAPVKYAITKQHPGSIIKNKLEWIEVDAFGKNGRKNVIHLFDQRRPGQVRGVPYLSPVIEHLKQLARYSEAELQAAVVSAALAIFVKMDADAFQTVFKGSTDEKKYTNRGISWDGSVSVDLDGPGKAVHLLPGQDVEVPELGRPNANYDPFFLSMLKQIGPVLEIPFEVLIKHFGSSYSASRAALLDFWRFVRVRRDFMATNFCEPIKELWFEEAVSLGRIRAPGFFSDPRIRQAYTRTTWVGDSPGSIDPEKEVNAAEKRIDLGISTREKESMLYDGGDWEANHTQLAKEQKMRDADGLSQEPKTTEPSLLQQS